MRQSKKSIFLVLMLVIIALTITAIVDIIVISQSSGSAIAATRLDDEPETYIVLNNPDWYFLEAISKGGEPVFGSFW